MIRSVKPFRVPAGSTPFTFVDPPTEVYKFLDREEWADGFAQRGEVKIGTLSHYRAQEGLDLVRGDAGEGQYIYTLESAQPETITADNAPWYLKPLIAKLGLPILSHGGAINIMDDYPDSYVFCASGVYTPALVAGYGPYCVKIHHVVGFYTALSRHLTDELGIASKEYPGAFGWCQYEDRGIKMTSASADVQRAQVAFIKRPEKGDELEVRALWHSAQANPSPRVVTCRELTAFCTRIR